MGTNKCLDKQLLCLYPFPHLSHLRSLPLAFLPSFISCCPSLALLIRDCLNPVCSSSSISSFSSSSIALSLRSNFPLDVNRILWPGRLAGGEGRLPRAVDLADALFDIVFRRWEIGIPNVPSLASLTAATIAATLLAVFEVTLFRRVTLWFEMREPEETEWEWFRECDLGREPEFADMERRCWLMGLEECCISLEDAILVEIIM
jgi:hypothetical protein